MRRLAAAGAGESSDETIRLDRAALAAASVPPPAALPHAAEPVELPGRPRRGWVLWAGVTIAALASVAIAFG